MNPARHFNHMKKKIDPVCTRCVKKESQASNLPCRNKDGYLSSTHSFLDPAQAKFESTLRTKADTQYKKAKSKARDIDWETLYKVQKEETYEVYKKLHETEDMLTEEKFLTSNLKFKLWSIVAIAVGAIIIKLSL